MSDEASKGPWPEPDNLGRIRARAFATANALADHADRREVELMLARFEDRSQQEIAALRRAVLEDLEVAALSLSILATARSLEELGGLDSADKAYTAAATLAEPPHTTEGETDA